MWCAIPGYEGFYEASDDGEIRRIASTSIKHQRLTPDQVTTIRQNIDAGRSYLSIAKNYPVTVTIIARIAKGEAYQPYSPTTLRPGLRRDGYRFVALCKNGIVRQPTVHSLVMAAFVGPRPNGAEINHKDGKRQNNILSNLEYVTQIENQSLSFLILMRRYKINITDAKLLFSMKV